MAAPLMRLLSCCGLLACKLASRSCLAPATNCTNKFVQPLSNKVAHPPIKPPPQSLPAGLTACTVLSTAGPLRCSLLVHALHQQASVQLLWYHVHLKQLMGTACFQLEHAHHTACAAHVSQHGDCS